MAAISKMVALKMRVQCRYAKILLEPTFFNIITSVNTSYFVLDFIIFFIKIENPIWRSFFKMAAISKKAALKTCDWCRYAKILFESFFHNITPVKVIFSLTL